MKKLLISLFDKKTILLLPFLFLSFVAHAGQGDSAYELLKRDLAANVKKLSRETRLYHYFELLGQPLSIEIPDLNSEEARKNFYTSLAFGGGKRFWDLNNSQTELSNAGPGYYLALDPYSSSPAAIHQSGKYFGPELIELTFFADANFLHLTSPIALKPDTMAALKNENLISTSQSDLSRLFASSKGSRGGHFSLNTLRYMVQPQNINFRVLVQKIFREQSVFLVEYTWPASVGAFCSDLTKNTSRKISSAMLFIGNRDDAPTVIKSVAYAFLPKIVNQFDTRLDIKSDWNNFSSELNLSPAEKEVYERNAKLYSLLKATRSFENTLLSQTTAESKKTELRGKIKSMIESTYKDSSELSDIKLNTFSCLP